MIAKKETVGTQVNRLREEKLLSSDEIEDLDNKSTWHGSQHHYRELRKYAKELEAEKEKNRWRKCSEELPDFWGLVVVYVNFKSDERPVYFPVVCCYDNKAKEFFGQNFKKHYKPIYWKPFIKPITPPESE